jgi:lipopolysaccharide export LptBFGC system permease protein LptF
MRHVIRGLIPPEAVRNKFKTGDVLDDIRPQAISLALQSEPGPELLVLQSKLQRSMQKALADIEAEIHSRLVFGIGCVSMILIGIGLGIIQKGGHLLSAFGASCVPAVGLIVCIMSGKQVTENISSKNVSGIVLMWAGLALLTLIAAGIYHRLLRH